MLFNGSLHHYGKKAEVNLTEESKTIDSKQKIKRAASFHRQQLNKKLTVPQVKREKKQTDIQQKKKGGAPGPANPSTENWKPELFKIIYSQPSVGDSQEINQGHF